LLAAPTALLADTPASDRPRGATLKPLKITRVEVLRLEKLLSRLIVAFIPMASACTAGGLELSAKIRRPL